MQVRNKFIEIDTHHVWQTSGSRYLLANDEGLVDSIIANKNTIQPGVALVVGGSNLFSIIPHLKDKITTLYMCDMDELLLDIHIIMYEVLKATKNLNDFFPALKKALYPLTKKYNFNADPFIRKLNEELFALKDKHFLYNSENYNNVHNALNDPKLKLEFVKIDLSHEKSANNLAKRLKGKQITYANFTNIGDYFDISSLSCLPFSAEAKISYSIGVARRLFSAFFINGFNAWRNEYYLRKAVYSELFHGPKVDRDENFKIGNQVLEGRKNCLVTASFENKSPIKVFRTAPLLKTYLERGSSLKGVEKIKYEEDINSEIKSLEDKVFHKEATGFDYNALEMLSKYRDAHIRNWDLSPIKQALSDVCDKQIRRLSKATIGQNLIGFKVQAFYALKEVLKTTKDPKQTLTEWLSATVEGSNLNNYELMAKHRNFFTFFKSTESQKIIGFYMGVLGIDPKTLKRPVYPLAQARIFH